MDITTLMGPVATGAVDAIGDSSTLAAPVLILLVALSIAFVVFRKFGIKR